MKMVWWCVALLAACRDNPSKLDHLAAPEPAAPAPTAATPIAFDPPAVEAWIDAQLAARGPVGAAVVVVRDGKPVIAKGYGTRRAGDGTPVTPDTPFALGSVSKQFACTAAYLLADAGKLAMTAPVATWYPQLTRATDITLADVGGHTSGYRDYYPLDYVDARMTTPIAPDALIARYATSPLDFEPGTRMSYSNTGFVILARVVEQVAGVPYAQLLADRIFTPLGMATATLARPAAAATGHVSFLLEGARPAPLEADGWLFGAGDIWASANDLAKWDLAIADGKLLSPASLRALATPRTLASGRGAGYSCGFFVRTVNNETILTHGGWVGGYRTRNTIIPRTRSAVIVLTNDQYTDVTSIADRITSWLTREDAAPAVAGPPPAEAARALIVQLQQGRVDRAQLGDDLAAYLDPARVAASAASLADLGPPAVTVTSRGERGGLEVTSLAVAFPGTTRSASMFRSPDGKIHQLQFTD